MRDFQPEMDVALFEASDDRVCVAAMAMNVAVALTDKELVTCSTKAFGYRARVRRYPLKSLKRVRLVRDGEGSLLSLEFHGTTEDLMLSFRPEETARVQAIVRVLQPRVGEIIEFDWQTPPVSVSALAGGR